jgi:RNA polymerase sigma factor FliA
LDFLAGMKTIALRSDNRGLKGSLQSGLRRRHLAFGERQRLIVAHLPEVRRIARHIQMRLPRHVSVEDLMQSGVLGLMDAIRKFDPSRNVPLRTYAQFRIRGAILDGLRELDASPRDLRRRARQIELAQNELAVRLGRAPTELEIAAHVHLSVTDLDVSLGELRRMNPKRQFEAGDVASYYGQRKSLADMASDDPFQQCLRSEIIRLLKEAYRRLGKRERQALALYYFQERTMKEVALFLQIHESRVSQMVTASLIRLRVLLEPRLRAGKDGSPGQ